MAVLAPGIPYTSQSEQWRGGGSERRDVFRPRASLCIEYRYWPGGREAFAINHAQIDAATNALPRFAVRGRRRSGDGPLVERHTFLLGSGSDPQRPARSLGGPARGEMASHVIDGQSGAEVVGPDGRILAGNAVVVDPAWRPATAAAAMMAASPDTSNTDYLGAVRYGWMHETGLNINRFLARLAQTAIGRR